MELVDIVDLGCGYENKLSPVVRRPWSVSSLVWNPYESVCWLNLAKKREPPETTPEGATTPCLSDKSSRHGDVPRVMQENNYGLCLHRYT